MRTVITKEHERFARKNFLKMSAYDIDKKFGVSKGCTRRILKKLGLKVPKEIIIKFRTEKRIGRTSFTQQEDDFIRSNYLTMPVKTIAVKLGRSYMGVGGRLKAMNLIIPPEIIEQRKLESRIKKGDVPPNKGKKMSPEVYEKAKATMFKPGQKPHNTKYDGHERIDKDGYIMIRVSLGKYVFKHRLLWEQYHGKIPKGMVVIFKNGKKTDIRIENLDCITLEENMTRNSLHRFPEELREIIQLKGALKRQINKRERQKNG